MQENFLPSLEKVLKYEGGFTNHPNDKGGPTNLGITLNTLGSFYDNYDYGDFDGDGQITIDDIRQLDTLEEAAPIYKTYYWDKLNLDIFPGHLDFVMFDFAVNSGPKNAVKLLQRAINRYVQNDINVDGSLGPITLDYVERIHPTLLLDGLFKEREIFYVKIIATNPSQEVFRRGWFNRLNALKEDVGEFI